jgi:hypothetical protein
MENLHAPTVPSGPTSGPANTNGLQTAGLSGVLESVGGMKAIRDISADFG